MILLISASQVARIIGMSHQLPVKVQKILEIVVGCDHGKWLPGVK
jgi:hypothetical protein